MKSIFSSYVTRAPSARHIESHLTLDDADNIWPSITGMCCRRRRMTRRTTWNFLRRMNLVLRFRRFFTSLFWRKEADQFDVKEKCEPEESPRVKQSFDSSSAVFLEFLVSLSVTHRELTSSTQQVEKDVETLREKQQAAANKVEMAELIILNSRKISALRVFHCVNTQRRRQRCVRFTICGMKTRSFAQTI